MQNISFVDEVFDEKLTTSYFLSIQFSLDGFYFCIFDPIRYKYIQYFQKKWENKSSVIGLDANVSEFDHFVKENQILTLSFKKVFVVFQVGEFSLVPNVLHQSDTIETVFKFTNDKEDNEVLIANRIRLADAFLIFPVSKLFKDLVEKHFPTAQLYHPNTIIIESLSINSKSSKTKNTITLSVSEKSFDLFGFSESNLLMANSFNYQNSTDLLYFLLNAVEQLKFNGENMELFLIGDVDFDGELMLLLKKYIRKVAIKPILKGVTFSYLFKDIPQHSRYSLFNVPLCAS